MHIISRHRLPQPYRGLLAVLWFAPAALLTATILIGKGFHIAFFDPRFLLLLGLMAIPAFYIWQQGIDVLTDGIVARVFVPRRYRYHDLGCWQLQKHPPVQQRILTIFDQQQGTVFSHHSAHITDLPILIRALQMNVSRKHNDEHHQ